MENLNIVYFLGIYDSFGLVFGWGDDGFVIYL